MWLLLLALGCGGDPPDTDTDIDTDSETDTDSATEQDGTDDDGDGWTIEAGDCNDADVFMSPGFPERENDDKDNDCDGRVDESFGGVLTLQVNTAGAETSQIHKIDLLGDLVQTWQLGGGNSPYLAAYWLDERADRAAWFAAEWGTASLWSIDRTGAATLWWSGAVDTDLEIERLFGVAAHPDGYALASAGNRLVRIEQGSATVLATWDALEQDGSHDIFAAALAVNPLDGAVTLFGGYGGVATWSATDGFQVVLTEDPLAPAGGFFDAHSTPQGGLAALGTYNDGQGAHTGVFLFDPVGRKFVLDGEWVDSTGEDIDYSPVAFTIDDARGDYYVTANAGWQRTVWRVFGGEDSFGSLLHPDLATLAETPQPADEARFFRAIAVWWDQD